MTATAMPEDPGMRATGTGGTVITRSSNRPPADRAQEDTD